MPETEKSAPAASPAPAGRRFGALTLVAVALASAALAAGAVVLLTRSEGAATASATGGPAAAPAVLYQCPMHPSIVQDHPGTCPICGMKLVKVEGGAGAAGAAAGHGAPGVEGMSAVEIDPARQQLIGLRTAEVAEGPVGAAWRTSGRVAIDETRVRHVNVKISGFVERIFVDFVGRPVRKGDPLFSIYSPELLAAQEELLLAVKTRKAMAGASEPIVRDGEALVSAARRKLALWDVPETELARIEETGEPIKALTFRSPVSGVVTKKEVVEGMKLEAGVMPYEIVDLSTVWVLADVYEGELRFVKEGLPATLRLKAFPNRLFEGKVVFIDPLLDPKTRTVKVRLTFPNPTGELRPEMFGEVVLEAQQRTGLRIPSDAVIDSGTQRIVFVALGDGKFQPRKVKLGEGDGSHVEVLSGVQAGEQVVTRANFLIDSESRLRASLAELGASESSDAGSSPPPVMSGHEGHDR